jgi:DNA repair exonuclease SbcCD ATPase subunit
MKVQDLRNKFERQRGKRDQLETSITTLQEGIVEKTRSLRRHHEAKEVIRIVGLMTQEQLQSDISDITSLALESVFPDPYELQVEFVIRRNKTECDIFFVRDGMKIEPSIASGVGAMDIASFALRIASWSMMEPHTRNTIILDEPFRNLSENYQEAASIMLKEISKKLGIQFIIVTHIHTLASYADRIFEVKKRKKVSKVTQS